MKHNQFKQTYDSIKKGGYTMNKGIQNEKMHMYGSTVGRSKYPCFLENNKRKMRPRPVTKIRPGALGYQLFNTCNWLQDIVKDMEYLCL